MMVPKKYRFDDGLLGIHVSKKMSRVISSNTYIKKVTNDSHKNTKKA